ncbi:MAG: TRAP transporter large permease [Synergistetes bacterium]|nr:TRAP transporter large permease [Synergistota bacterium]
MEVFWLFFLLFACLALGVPIGISIGVATATVIFFTSSIPLVIIAQRSFTALNSFPLLAIPLFILAGVLMGAGGVSRRLINLADSIVGFATGGLAMVTVLACMFFSAISGSSTATVSAIGSFMIPEMEKRNYDRAFAAALTAAAGCIGVIIPPSISFVIYGIVAQVSIGKLFIAGVIPGIVMGLSLMVVGYFISKKQGYSRGVERPSLSRVWKAFKEAIWALLVPIIILGGIYGGIFTPTEAGGVSVVYSVIVGVFIYRELGWREIYNSLKETVKITGAVIFMIGLSMTFARYLTIERIPIKIVKALLSVSDNPYVILFVINLFLLGVGCFIDNFSSTVILTPILLPIIKCMGIDPVHFGVIMTIALTIGFITPPYGPNLFVASAVSKVSMEIISRKVLWFFLVLVLVLVLVTYVPSLSTYLVNLLLR